MRSLLIKNKKIFHSFLKFQNYSSTFATMPSRSDAIKLCQKNLPQFVHSKIEIPTYDRTQITSSIVHIGVGGFHRSHQALYAERLIVEQGITDCGICGVGLLPLDAHMNTIMQKQDCLYTLMTKQQDGTVEPRVIGSIVEYMHAPENPERLNEIFCFLFNLIA